MKKLWNWFLNLPGIVGWIIIIVFGLAAIKMLQILFAP